MATKKQKRVKKVEKEQEEEQERYILTPMGHFSLALLDSGLVDDIDDRKIDIAWTLFECYMTKAGYVSMEKNEHYD